MSVLSNFEIDTSAASEKNMAEIDKILLADDETKLKRLRLLAGEEGLDVDGLRRRQTLLRRIEGLERAAEVPPELSGQIAAAYQAASSFFDETEEIVSLRRSEHDRLMSVGQSLQFQRDAIARATAQLADLRRQLSGVPAVPPEPPEPTFTYGQSWVDAENERERLVRQEENENRGAFPPPPPRSGFTASGTQHFYCTAMSQAEADEMEAAATGRPLVPTAKDLPRPGSVQSGAPAPTMEELLSDDDVE